MPLVAQDLIVVYLPLTPLYVPTRSTCGPDAGGVPDPLGAPLPPTIPARRRLWPRLLAGFAAVVVVVECGFVVVVVVILLIGTPGFGCCCR